jgi:hypothetical protein
VLKVDSAKTSFTTSAENLAEFSGDLALFDFTLSLAEMVRLDNLGVVEVIDSWCAGVRWGIDGQI